MRARGWAWLALCLAPLAGAQTDVARVESFTPQGTARGVQQVTARFSVPMVAFGDPRASAPFDVDCPAPGTGRWLDDRVWVYEFPSELPAGLACP